LQSGKPLLTDTRNTSNKKEFSYKNCDKEVKTYQWNFSDMTPSKGMRELRVNYRVFNFPDHPPNIFLLQTLPWKNNAYDVR